MHRRYTYIRNGCMPCVVTKLDDWLEGDARLF